MYHSEDLTTLQLLPVPEPAVARHPDTIVRPGELRNWLRQLPVAAPGHLADLLLRQLTHLVRDPNPPTHYRHLLKSYHAPAQALQRQVWEAMRPGKTPRRHLEGQQNAVSQLLLEISYGHARLANQHITASMRPEAGDLFHALVPLTRLIQWDLLQYNLIRPSIWQQALHLYSVSELYGLSGVEVDSELSIDTDPSDIHSSFHAALALQLCDPYRLPYPQVCHLIAGLGRLAQYLGTTADDRGGHQCIAVSLAGELPPRRFALSGRDRTPLYLQLDGFLEQLQRSGLPQDPDGELMQWLSRSLQALTIGSSGAEARRQQRHLRQADYHFQVGLKTIQQRLQELVAPSAPVAQETAGIQVDDGFVSPSPQLGTPCRQKDHSADGAGFLLHANAQLPAIGELALFEADARDRSLSGVGFVAHVRRHLRREDGSHEIGVEKLKGNLIPVGIGTANAPALLHVDRQQRRCVLIAPPDTFVASNRLTLNGLHKEYRVCCQALLEQHSQQYILVTLE